MPTTRRDLLKLGGLAAAATSTPTLIAAAATSTVARAERPLRILILGGTGFTGPHQVRYALARGHAVTVFNRGRRPQQWPGAVTELVGDRALGQLDALKEGEWDVCIDNPTSIPRWVRDVGRVLKGRVGQYIFISTISVYADTSRPPDESSAVAEYAGKDVMAETQETLRADMSLYGPLKAACEREAEQRFPGITTVIRPGLIVGPGDETDRFTYWPVRIARGGEVAAPGDGSDPVQYIDARDLAEWTIRMAEQRAFGTYNALGPDYALTIAAMLYGIRATTTAGARFTWIPTEFLAEQQIAPWGDMPTWVPGSGESAGFARVSNAKAVARGLTFRPLATTAAETLTWFHSLPAERRAQLRAGMSADREVALLKAWAAKRTG